MSIVDPVSPHDEQPVFRFAPSPNGPLHRGHALSALLNAELARRQGGRFLVRIEDIDAERSRPEHIAAIEADLAWLGLQWEKPIRHQSRYMQDYAQALSKLQAMDVVYPCFCSRAAISQRVQEAEANGVPWPRDPDGAPLYDGTCRRLQPEEAAARILKGDAHQWRLNTERALQRVGDVSWRAFDPITNRIIERRADPQRWGDPVIARKGLSTSYHLSVVVDDTLQGITHVVRGMDLEAATDIHALLQALLKLPQPLYWHHPLVFDATGQKLSKSKSSLALVDERAQGLTPEMLRAEALHILSR